MVEDEHQSRGVGRLLVGGGRVARDPRGATHLKAEMLDSSPADENVAMLRLDGAPRRTVRTIEDGRAVAYAQSPG